MAAPQRGGCVLTSSVFAHAAGGRLCSGKRANLPTARPFPVIQEVMASMAHLQKEKLRLQEELLELQEKLAAQENNELSLSLQLQSQVWGGQGDTRESIRVFSLMLWLGWSTWHAVSGGCTWKECRISITEHRLCWVLLSTSFGCASFGMLVVPSRSNGEPSDTDPLVHPKEISLLEKSHHLYTFYLYLT